MPDYPEDPISTVEEEELGPHSRTGRADHSFALEAALAGVILLAVVAFAGAQWWQQWSAQERYRVADREAYVGDWAAARDAFAGLHGYADAGQRAAQADRMLTYTLALSGAVALRPSAPPPGLYFYGPSGWHSLPGSDGLSRVYGTCPDGSFVYDGPWQGPAAAPTPEPGRLAAREIIVTTRAGRERGVLQLDPGIYDSYTCAARGVWGMHPTQLQPGYGDSFSAVPSVLTGYQAFGSPQPVDLTPSDHDWSIIGVAPDGEHTIMAGTSPQAVENWNVPIYAAGMDGLLRHLADLPGAPGLAQPLGSGVLVPVYHPLSVAGGFANTVLWVDLAHPGTSRVLAQADVAAATFSGHLRMTASPLSKGSRAGQAAISWPEGDHARLRIVDPARPSRPLLDFTTPAGVGVPSLLDESPEGDLVFGAETYSVLLPRTDVLIYVDPRNRVQQISPSLGPGSRVSAAWVRDGHLVYLSLMQAQSFTSPNALFIYFFQSLPLTGLRQEATRPIAVTAGVGTWPLLGPPWYLGPEMLAYVTKLGELRIARYDGSSDTVLEQGVSAFAR